MFNLKEDSRTEFKYVLNDTLEKEVIAFLTKNGGNIYIGIDDDGNVAGVKEDIDVLQRKIKDRIKNNILPNTLGLFDIEVENYNNKDVIHIIVASGNQKPYYLRKEGMTPKGCFIRVGSAVESLTENQIEELYSKRTRNSLTGIVSPTQKLKFSQLKIYYEEQGYTINNNFLEQLGLVMDDGKYNYLAYLLADNNSISMKVATYSGTDSYDLIENEEFGYCSIIKATKSVLDKLNLINRTFTKITSEDRKELEMVDKLALKEAVLNAVVHNSWEREVPPRFEVFSNRITITSSGGIPKNFTEYEFLKGYSSPVNPEIMRVFKDLHMVEQLGTGLPRILSAYSEDVYTFTPNFIKIDFKFNENTLSGVKKENLKLEIELNNTEQEILKLMKENSSITQNEIANKLRINRVSVAKNIKKLKGNGIITRVGSNKTGSWKILK